MGRVNVALGQDVTVETVAIIAATAVVLDTQTLTLMFTGDE